MVVICTLNVLSPELMLYFWRSSYGLPTLKENKDYDDVMKSRITNCVSYLKKIKPDVLCLQEITNKKYTYLNH